MVRSKFARRFERAKTMGLFLGLLALLFHVVPGGVKPVHAQGSRKDDVVVNSRGIPLAGASIRVCAMPASGQPCSPLAQIYSDAALTQALANPTTSDGMGNYHFYAAPGKYMIEISGPGITIRQTPDVIIPMDPSSPNFPGNISAFSLNLAGNLTVNGNTSVIGSLASGTLNLSNQTTPPGAASAGTVNLYTKSDKRLYYQDDAGTEIGPISSASGAQTNISNTFTAPQNIDSDFHVKGPNPNIDLSRFGGYSHTSPIPSTTGSISAGSNSLALASAQDFANGQGLVIYKAGATPTISTPPTPTVTPTGILNGTTTYSYQVIAEDKNGGLTAASPAGTTTTGAATLGVTVATLASATRSGTVATYTSTSAHNFQNGSIVCIGQFGGGTGCPGNGNDLFNGVKTITSTPTGTTFTVSDPIGYANTTENTGSPIAEVLACNKLTFSTFSGTGTLRYWIYRSVSGGAYSLVGVAQGLDPFYIDCGLSTPSAPSYVPSTPPASPQAGYLATTIVSGGSTTSLTLANNATTTAASSTVLHDNTPALTAALQAAINAGGATVYIPAVTSPTAISLYPFNSTLNMPALLNPGTFAPLHILINASLSTSQPWVLRQGVDIEGMPKNLTSFSALGTAVIFSSAYPSFYMAENSSGSIHLNRLHIALSGAQQSAIYADEGTDGGATPSWSMDDLAITGAGGSSRPMIFKGAFGFIFHRGICDTTGGAPLTTPACLEFTNSSPAVVTGGGAQVPGSVILRDFNFVGTGILIDSYPNPTPAATSGFRFEGGLMESRVSPYVRINGMGLVDEVEISNFGDSDSRAGGATPVFDGTGSDLRRVIYRAGTVSQSFNPLVIANGPGATLYIEHPGSFDPSNVSWFDVDNNFVSLNNQNLIATNGGRVIYSLPNPGAPSGAVSSGGNIPPGTYTYSVTAVDADGNETVTSPAISETVTSGNQTVTITAPPFGNGTVGWYVYRNNARALINIVTGSCTSPIPVTTTQWVDTFNTICAPSPPNFDSAGSTIISQNGLSSWKFQLNANVLASPAGVLGKTWTFADHNTQFAPSTAKPSSNIGFTLETGILQSAFDNFNRANGAIGSNWTVQAGGINVNSNSVVGTNSTNNWAFYSAPNLPVTADQFAEITLPSPVPAGGGAGPGVRMSSTGSGADNYNCHPNNNTLFLERVLNGSSAILTSVANTSAAGDVVRLEVVGNTLNCYYNGVLKLTATDNNLTTGSPGVELFNTAATLDNWTGGNLVPLAHTSAEQDFSQVQHFPFGLTVGPLSLAAAPSSGITMGAESFASVPRAVVPTFLPGALTATWTGSTFTLDKAITVTRVQVQAKTPPSGCTTNAIVRLSDGTTNQDVTISGAANDSGAIAKNYAAGAALTVSVQTAAAGCATAPADGNVIVQYKMQ